MTVVCADASAGQRTAAAIIPPSTCLFMLTSVGRVRPDNAHIIVDVPANGAPAHATRATKQPKRSDKRNIVAGTLRRVLALAGGIGWLQHWGRPWTTASLLPRRRFIRTFDFVSLTGSD